ncbi:MAG: hypothetical protein AB8F95_17760 [Bacteroidia bacterium]
MKRTDPMFPFVISAIVSGVAMGLLWFYFDFLEYTNIYMSQYLGSEVLQEFFNLVYKQKQFWHYGYSTVISYDDLPFTKLTLHWTLLPILLPAIAFMHALLKPGIFSKNLQSEKERFAGKTLVALFYWIVVMYLMLAGIEENRLYFFTNTFLSPIASLLGVVLLAYLIKDRYPNIRSQFTNKRVLLYFIIPAAILFIDFVIKTIIPRIFEKSTAIFWLDLRQTIIMAAPVAFVIIWQLAFGWMLVKSDEVKTIVSKIHSIGEDH